MTIGWKDSAPGRRAVRLLSFDGDEKRIGARQHGAGAVGQGPGGIWHHVQAEDGVNLGILEYTFLDHLRGAAGLTRRQTFLSGLEDHFHGSRETVFHPRERGGRAEEDRHVVIVTARVHHPHFLAVPLRLRDGLERQVALLGHRQRIHVGTERDDRARQSAFEHADDTRGGDACRHGEAQLSQFVSDDLGGPRFAVAELGVLMKVASPRDDLRIQFQRRAARLRQRADWGLARSAPAPRRGRATRRAEGFACARDFTSPLEQTLHRALVLSDGDVRSLA